MSYKTGDTICSIDDGTNTIKFVVTDDGLSINMTCDTDIASIKLNSGHSDYIARRLFDFTETL